MELNRHAHRNALCDTINHDEPSIQFSYDCRDIGDLHMPKRSEEDGNSANK